MLGLHGEHLPAACETPGTGQVAHDLIHGDETPILGTVRQG